MNEENKRNEASLRLSSIASQFKIKGKVVDIVSFGSGHINDTYKVITDNGDEDYLLQRINHHVFKNIEQLMRDRKSVV